MDSVSGEGRRRDFLLRAVSRRARAAAGARLLDSADQRHTAKLRISAADLQVSAIGSPIRFLARADHGSLTRCRRVPRRRRAGRMISRC
jgi:hypothetical protein